jgi:hypothetical protein
MPKALTITLAGIEREIHLIRGQKVLLDEDLARLYGVETRRLNEAVKRNRARFPEDFAFRLTEREASDLKSQIATSRPSDGSFTSKSPDFSAANLKSQIATSSSHGGRRRSAPMAFTEQGVAMLSSVLGSPRAIAVNIGIMRAFVKMRQVLAMNTELAKRLAVVEAKLDQHRAEAAKSGAVTSATLAEHEKHIRVVFEAIRQLMADGEPKPPARVGFKLHESGHGYQAGTPAVRRKITRPASRPS